MTTPSPVRRNILANFGGSAWQILIALAFMPWYLRLLGPEGYGLFGVFYMLQGIFAVLDLGLGVTLNRAMAQQHGREGRTAEATLLRTLEIIYFAIGVTIGVLVALSAPVLAGAWLQPGRLAPERVADAIALMGLALATRWPMALYQGGLMGQQRQVGANVIAVCTSTLQNVGALLLLVFVEPSVTLFFAFNALGGLAGTLASRTVLWRSFEPAGRRARFSLDALRPHWRFTSGVFGISVATAVLSQLDKVVLGRIVSLEDFGYYSFATRVAWALACLSSPLFQTFFPRLSQLVSQGGQQELCAFYHRACQFTALVVLPAGIAVALFPRPLLAVWLGDAAYVDSTVLLVSLLVAGQTINSLMMPPHALQLAHGWTRLALLKCGAAVLLLVPLLLGMVGIWGLAGAAGARIVLNAGYMAIEIPIMHRRLLVGEKRRWYLRDVLAPAMLCAVVALPGLALVAAMPSPAAQLVAVALLAALMAAAVMGILPSLRGELLRGVAALRRSPTAADEGNVPRNRLDRTS